MVWDREKNCVLSFGMESMGGDNVCYKGIRLTERMESGKCSDSLYLNQMDVLDGVGNDWVDAARMKLSLAARRKLESVVEEATAFAKEYMFSCWMNFIKTMILEISQMILMQWQTEFIRRKRYH